MRNISTYAALLFIALLAGACELAKLGEPIVVSDIDPEFQITPWEVLAPEGRVFQLRINTLQTSPCLNTRIDYKLSKINNRIDISLRDIVDPADCDPGEKPARAWIDLGGLPVGFFELNIDLKNEIFNRGQIAVYGDRYVISMRTRNGFVLLPQELRRVPEQTIWGYVTFTQDTDEPLARQFVNDLRAISLTRNYSTGYYGYFQIAETGLISVAEAPSTPRIQPFIYSYPGAKDQLLALLNRYRTDYPSQLTIKLLNSLGEEL